MANVLLLFAALVTGCLCVDPPVFHKTYKATGTIRLPYAEIVEPFVAYYDAPNNRSRIDYYNGTESTIQKSMAPGYPYGTSYMVVPYTDKKVYNKMTCFQINGTKDMSVDITTIIPDLTAFKFIGVQPIKGMKANTFQLVVPNGQKVSTYTFWASQSANQPIRYEMMGYDTLLGSHFDKYYVDYFTWESPASFVDADFRVPNGMSCGSFPGPGDAAETRILMNPIREYIHHDDAHVHEAFEHFKVRHGKKYSYEEHSVRKQIFKHNLRYIHSKNRAGLSYTLAVNHLADQSDKELKMLRGFRYSHSKRNGNTFSLRDMRTTTVPDQWDWRLIGAVTPVKDQAICGSCWSFGTTGTIEGANFLKTGKLVRLSQQQLMDCSWGYGNNACDGGEDFRAYHYIMDNGGLTSEEQYGQYKPIDSYCLQKSVTPVVKISNFTTLPQGDESALKIAVFNKGPISVAIDAAHKSLSFYANGVYYEPTCKNDPDGLDHAVLVVGYGSLNGHEYWLVKNSWSTYWGNDGYVLMSQKDNNCGVATDATYVDIV